MIFQIINGLPPSPARPSGLRRAPASIDADAVGAPCAPGVDYGMQPDSVLVQCSWRIFVPLTRGTEGCG
jgi:hypothetical protein